MQFYERCSDGTFEVAEDWLVECTICRHRYRIDRCSLHISASYLDLLREKAPARTVYAALE